MPIKFNITKHDVLAGRFHQLVQRVNSSGLSSDDNLLHAQATLIASFSPGHSWQTNRSLLGRDTERLRSSQEVKNEYSAAKSSRWKMVGSKDIQEVSQMSIPDSLFSVWLAFNTEREKRNTTEAHGLPSKRSSMRSATTGSAHQRHPLGLDNEIMALDAIMKAVHSKPLGKPSDFFVGLHKGSKAMAMVFWYDSLRRNPSLLDQKLAAIPEPATKTEKAGVIIGAFGIPIGGTLVVGAVAIEQAIRLLRHGP